MPTIALLFHQCTKNGLIYHLLPWFHFVLDQFAAPILYCMAAHVLGPWNNVAGVRSTRDSSDVSWALEVVPVGYFRETCVLDWSFLLQVFPFLFHICWMCSILYSVLLDPLPCRFFGSLCSSPIVFSLPLFWLHHIMKSWGVLIAVDTLSTLGTILTSSSTFVYGGYRTKVRFYRALVWPAQCPAPSKHVWRALGTEQVNINKSAQHPSVLQWWSIPKNTKTQKHKLWYAKIHNFVFCPKIA